MVDPLLEISEEDSGRWCALFAAGEIDVSTASKLRERLDAAIDRGTALVVVDLSSVTFIDSTGLGVLIGTSKRVEDAGGALRVVATEPRILKLFEITGLTERFAIAPSLDEAVAS